MYVSLNTLRDQNNYCSVDSDCLVTYDIKTNEPCACYEIINKNVDTAAMQQAAQAITKIYLDDCSSDIEVFNCINCPVLNNNKVGCTDGKCVIKY